MGITLTDEQEELRELVRGFLAERAPRESIRRAMESESGYDRAVWQQMAQQLGLHALFVPEPYGGAGYGLPELTVVLEQMGYALLPAPFFSTIALAAQTLSASGDDDACAAYLPGIAAGELTATVAVCDESGSWRLEDIATTAQCDHSDVWTVSGTKMFVIDGDTADLLLVIARTGGGLGLFAVDGNAEGVIRTRLDALDPTRRLARVDLDGAPARRVGPGGDAEPFLRKALDTASVALGAEQVGGAQACLDMAVDYAKVRVQFDRPIGSFQAIKHMCADMAVAVETGRAAVGLALDELVTGDAPTAAVSTAKAYVGDAAVRVCTDAVQAHGGIGFTWEHDAHLWLKRALLDRALFGSSSWHRRRVADAVLPALSPAPSGSSPAASRNGPG